jgi:hypothetical protein
MPPAGMAEKQKIADTTQIVWSSAVAVIHD